MSIRLRKQNHFGTASGCNFIKSQNFHIVLCSFDHIGFVVVYAVGTGTAVAYFEHKCMSKDDDNDGGDDENDVGSASSTDSLGICSFATMNYEWPEVNIT